MAFKVCSLSSLFTAIQTSVLSGRSTGSYAYYEAAGRAGVGTRREQGRPLVAIDIKRIDKLLVYVRYTKMTNQAPKACVLKCLFAKMLVCPASIVYECCIVHG